MNAFYLIVSLLFVSIIALSASDKNSIKLPPPQLETGKTLMKTLSLRHSSREFSSQSLSLQQISNLLWAADGINRPGSGHRTAPSARNYQEIDVYVILEDGAYCYEPKSHSLILVAKGDLRKFAGTQDFVWSAPLNLIYVADKSKLKEVSNPDMAQMYFGFDAGVIAENVYLYCASEELNVVVRASVDKFPLAKALGLKENQQIIAGQTVGYAK